MLEQVTAPGALAVPTATLAAHLHLNTAAPELDETETLERLIEAATASIERQTQTALIMQTWRWSTATWRKTLPLRPVAAIESIEIVDSDGDATPWTGWFLVHGPHPRIGTRKGQTRPAIPHEGHARITFTAGYGTGWTDVPPDIRQAITLLAAHWYEHREAATDPLAALPFGVASLTAPYRPIRL
jgi:uncharacterized phiE125 gp8 family phage protein